MNNPFDPAQLGGNMRGIVGSKLFGKSLPTKDTVAQFVYGRRAPRNLGMTPSYPSCAEGCKVSPNGVSACSVGVYDSMGQVSGYVFYKCDGDKPTMTQISAPADAFTPVARMRRTGRMGR